MRTWASVVDQPAHISSTGGSVLHFITPGALDGFAVGALLSGLCLLVIVAPRMMRRSRLSAGEGSWTDRMRVARVRPDYFAATADGEAFGAAASDSIGQVVAPELADVAASDSYSRAPGSDPYASPAPTSLGVTVTSADPYGTGAADDFGGPAGTGSAEEPSHSDSGRSGYRSKHRMTGSENPDRRPEARRTQPRHAAPSVGFSNWVSGRFGAFALPARG